MTQTTQTNTELTDQDMKAHFATIMKRRNAKVAYETFEQASVMSDGLKLHLDVIETSATAPTMVFVPGTSVYGLTFGNYLAAIAEQGMNVVSVDLRGHGRSEGVKGSYTVHELVADARAAILYAKKRFKGSVFVSGSSQGGIVAFYLAASNEELAGVVCHNAADLADSANAKLTDHPVITRLLKPLVLGLAKLFPEASINVARYYSLLSRGDQTVKDRMLADPWTLKVITLKALASLSSARLVQPVEKITTPILFLHGEDDNIFPLAFTQGLYQRLTCDKEMKVYPGIGHFLITEQVDTFLPDVMKWVNKRCRIVN